MFWPYEARHLPTRFRPRMTEVIMIRPFSIFAVHYDIAFVAHIMRPYESGHMIWCWSTRVNRCPSSSYKARSANASTKWSKVKSTDWSWTQSYFKSLISFIELILCVWYKRTHDGIRWNCLNICWPKKSNVWKVTAMIESSDLNKIK